MVEYRVWYEAVPFDGTTFQLDHKGKLRTGKFLTSCPVEAEAAYFLLCKLGVSNVLTGMALLKRYDVIIGEYSLFSHHEHNAERFTHVWEGRERFWMAPSKHCIKGLMLANKLNLDDVVRITEYHENIIERWLSGETLIRHHPWRDLMAAAQLV